MNDWMFRQELVRPAKQSGGDRAVDMGLTARIIGETVENPEGLCVDTESKPRDRAWFLSHETLAEARNERSSSSLPGFAFNVTDNATDTCRADLSGRRNTIFVG